MTIVVQEFDGSFSHSIVVDDFHTVHDLPCHSKLKKYVVCACVWMYLCLCVCTYIRMCVYVRTYVCVCVCASPPYLVLAFTVYIRSRKRKMIVSTGEEIEIDVSGTEYVVSYPW